MLYNQLIQSSGISQHIHITQLLKSIPSDIFSQHTHYYKHKKSGNSLIKYIKKNWDMLDADVREKLGYARSLVLQNEKLIGFSPIKTGSFSMEEFGDEETRALMKAHNMYFVEMVEGTMINVCYNGTEWVVSTRSILGASNKYFKHSTKNFKQMFQETIDFLEFSLDELDTSYSYSFVMKHPDNRIINNVETPELYIVGLYKITENDNEVNDDEVNDDAETTQSFDKYFNGDYCVQNIDFYQHYYGTRLVELGIKFPRRYHSCDKHYYEGTFQHDDDVMSVCYEYHNVEQMPCGVYFTNGLVYYKLRDRKYEQYKLLKGNQPKLQFQFLNLWKNDKLHTYMQTFPEHSPKFMEFSEQIGFFGRILYQNYISCFCKKEAHLKSYPFEMRVHMYHLHKMYKNVIVPNIETTGIRSIQPYHVYEYLKTVPTAKLMYFLNYSHRPEVIERRQKEFLEAQKNASTDEE